jgi:hypothetical protein
VPYKSTSGKRALHRTLIETFSITFFWAIFILHSALKSPFSHLMICLARPLCLQSLGKDGDGIIVPLAYLLISSQLTG